MTTTTSAARRDAAGTAAGGAPQLTVWGESLDPDRVLEDYPRPQMVRERWACLNGWWDWAITQAHGTEAAGVSWAGSPPRGDQWQGRILVPFSPETPLSQVERTLLPDQILWYRRTVQVPDGFRRSGERLVLRFGAVDQECVVHVDGEPVASHVGGFTPFSVDLGEPLAEAGSFELVVAVRDQTDRSFHARGKQRLSPGGIWYRPQSGIWQTVWMEPVPTGGVKALALTPRLAFDREGRLTRARLDVTVEAPGAAPDATALVVVSGRGREIARSRLPVGAVRSLELPVTGLRLWSPEDPFLHDVEVRLGRDRVASYTGLRAVGIGRDSAGIPRILLNGRPYFPAGVLDQGYWSDGWLTAPSEQALVHDVEFAKSLGFTMIRKHIKIEPLRWYHACDRLGMLVWQDMVNGGGPYRPEVITAPAFLDLRVDDHRYELFGREDAAGRGEFLDEMAQTVRHLRNAPSVVAWVVFNEGWGQFDAARVAEQLRDLDDTRVIDHASGWYDQRGGDVRSLHVYFRPFRMRRAWRAGPRAVVLSEYGGYSLRVDGHALAGARPFGYRRYRSRETLTAALARLHRRQILPALHRGLSATVYTQLSDVEGEDNGLTTSDRRVVKVDVAAMRAVLSRLRLPGQVSP